MSLFEVSRVKREILIKLTEKDWTPTELSKELDKSTEAIYNHLNSLAELGILEKEKVPAKTRPKNKYSIDDGFIQYLAVLPGSFISRTLPLTQNKKTILKIWDIDQEEFHTYLENFWWTIKNNPDFKLGEDILAIAIYGSVARGTADKDSDIDIFLIVNSERTAKSVKDLTGALKINADDESKLFMSQVYTKEEYTESKKKGSDFIGEIGRDLHPIYDPEGIL